MPLKKSPKPVASQKVEKPKKVGFFKAIPASIYSPKFYATIPQRSFWKAFRYFLGVLTLILFILLAVGGVFVMKYKDEAMAKFRSIPENYPQDLVLTMQGGKFSTNAPEPFFVPIPESWGDLSVAGTDMKNLIVIDTKTPFDIPTMEKYATFIWMGETSVFVKSEQEVKIYDLSTMPDGQVTKEMIGVMWLSLENTLKPFVIVAAIGGVIGYYLAMIALEMIYLLFFALLAVILAAILGTKLTYGDCYKMGFHILTVSFLLSFVIRLTQTWTHFSGFILLPTLVMLLMLGANLWEAKRQKLL
ncbi:MAG: DUF1189 family protein [Candidatus Gracilibacteria bacterium]